MSISAIIANTVNLASLRRRAKKGHKGKKLSSSSKSVHQGTPKGEGSIITEIDDSHSLKCERNLKNPSLNYSNFSQSSINLNKNINGGGPERSVSRWHEIIEQIQQKVCELEATIYEDQQREFKLKMALERQTELVNDLRFSLDTEKQRNKRLVELIKADENSQKSENESEEVHKDLGIIKWQTSLNSISPLLMQQRYDELSDSYKKVNRQLAKKKKLLVLEKCKHEELQAKFDYLFDGYRTEQKRFTDICGKYLMLQFKKQQEILCFRESLSYATDCIINARHMLDDCQRVDKNLDKEFKQNLQYFITALRHCNSKKKPPLSNFV